MRMQVSTLCNASTLALDALGAMYHVQNPPRLASAAVDTDTLLRPNSTVPRDREMLAAGPGFLGGPGKYGMRTGFALARWLSPAMQLNPEMKPSSYPEINHQSLSEIYPLCSTASRDPHGFLCTARYGSIRWSSHTTHLYYTVARTPSVTQNHPRNPKPHLSFRAGYALCRAASRSLTVSFTHTHALSLFNLQLARGSQSKPWPMH